MKNKKSIALLVVFVLLLSSGCATYSSGYTPKVGGGIEQKIDAEPKKDITFSVSYSQHIGQSAPVNERKIVEAVRKNLRDAGIYKSIKYSGLEQAGNNHLHFQFHLTGTKFEEAIAKGYLSGLLLTAIPMTIDYYADMSVFVLQDGKEEFSSAAAEKINQVFWLPLIIASPFFNDYTAASRVLKKQVSYLVADIKESGVWASDLGSIEVGLGE